jgi:hypothetical protein
MPTNLTPAKLAEGLRRMNDPAATQYEVESWLLNYGETALRELAAMREHVAWRPIDEAPKNGTEIIATNQASGVYIGAFYGPTFLTSLGHCRREPTHWQPLPEPPRGQA